MNHPLQNYIRKISLREFHLFFCCKKSIENNVKVDFGAMLFMDDNDIISTLKRQHYCMTQLRFLIIDQL